METHLRSTNVRIIGGIIGLSLTVCGLSNLILQFRGLLDDYSSVLILFSLLWLGIIGLGQLVLKKTLAPKIFRIEFIITTILMIIGISTMIIGLGPSFTNEANAVCQGGKLPRAADYTGNELHPIIINYKGEEKDYSIELPTGWSPRKVDQIQLVACIVDYWEYWSACQYLGQKTGEGVSRKQNFMVIKLISAKRGELVDTISIIGEEPPECPEFISAGSPHWTMGIKITDELLIGNLAKYVNPSNSMK